MTELDPSVGQLRLRRLLRAARVTPLQRLDEVEVGPGVALLVWLDALLAKRKPVTDEQRDLLVDVYAEAIVKFGWTAIGLAEDPPGEMPVFQLVVADNTFAGLTGENVWLDLRTGAFLGGPPFPPIEAVSYNLVALYVYHHRRLEAAREQNEAGKPRCSTR